MEPSAYIPAYVERCYNIEHPELTPAAQQLVHDEVRRHPERYATTPHAQALVSYLQVHETLMRKADALDDIASDEEFIQRSEKLFQETRVQLQQIWRTDQLCIDAQLVDIQLSDAELDAQLGDMMQLEQKTRGYLQQQIPGFDADAPGFVRQDDGAGRVAAGGAGGADGRAADTDGPLAGADDASAALLENPEFIAWLHTLEAISHACLGSARYRAAVRYSTMVMQVEGYPSWAAGTRLLALARLEDEDGFFAAARAGGPEVEGSPWFLLGRALLLYKVGRRKNARRALREFANRCDGGAFFLLNPTYHAPYLPVRPAPRESWSLSHQAVWEADGIIVDTPDFVPWAASIEGVDDISEAFASRNGF